MATITTPNAEQVQVNVVGSSSFGRYPKISLEKTYNMFISDGWLVDFPGYAKIQQLIANGGEGRALFRSFRQDILIAVVDANVYRLDNQFSPILIGSLQTTSGEVQIDENLSNQICIVDGTFAYIYYTLLPPNLAIQTDATLFPIGTLKPNYVTYHNTFFLFGNSDKTSSGAFWYVFRYNADSGAGAIEFHDQLSLQTKPDYALAVKRSPGQSANVVVFGASCCEIHTQTTGISASGEPLTYTLNRSVSIDYGTQNVATIADNDTIMMWLGVNEKNAPVLLLFDNQSVQRVSTDGIDYFLDSIKHPEQSTGMMYRKDGHLFYHLTFYHPDDNVTILYDVNEKKFFHATDHKMDYHPARQVVAFNNETYFISINGGYIYKFSTDLTYINEDIADTYGQFETDPRLRYEIPRVRICKPVRFPTSVPFRANSFVVTIEQGCDDLPAIQDCLVYMITEDNIRMFSEDNIQLVPEHYGQEDCESHPYRARVDLALSRDGGETFGNYVGRLLNPIGQRKNILRWERMGNANDLTMKLKFWSLGRFVVNDGLVEVSA